MQNVESSCFSNTYACQFAFHELECLHSLRQGGKCMRVISRTRLRKFWESAGYTDSEGPLRAWYSHVSHRSVAWQSWSDVKIIFGSASLVGNCVVFNIGGKAKKAR
ncbi:MAG: type II toxin-antitoxin system HigB family toxin [Planctomycetota bacterium]